MDKREFDRFNAGSRAEAETAFRKMQHTLPFRLLLKGFQTATKFLPVILLRITGILVVVVFIVFNYRNYRAIQKNLSRVSSGLSGSAYAWMAFSVFKNYSYYLIDLFYLSHDPARIREYSINIKGIENLERALAQNKGIILLTTHLGNWEIGGLKLSSMGREIYVAYSPDSMSQLETQRGFIRKVKGINEVPLSAGGFSSLRLLRILQDGGTVALQGDRLTFDSGVKINFFEGEALLPKGPVKLAIVSESLVLPVFMPITGLKSYEIIIEEPIEMEKNTDPEAELKTNLNRIITILEKYIRRYKTQWYTFMPFWEQDKKDFNQ